MRRQKLFARMFSLPIAVGCVLFFLDETAFAQRRRAQGQSLPQPSLQSVLPLGVKAGGTAEIILRGTDLEGVTSLWFDHPGLKAEHVKDLTFKITCGPETPIGHHDIRALGTYGVSNPRVFVVGDRAEVKETEPNNTPAEAKIVAINTTINGEINPAADIDCFAFEGKKGQRLLFEVEAERVDSKLDATLRLFDASSRAIAESRDVFGDDPFLDVTLPTDGRYVVKLHDVIYQGSPDAVYRLTITDGPHVDAIIPAIVRAGVPTEVTLVGRNLGGSPAPDLSFDGRPLERKTVTITPPNSPEPDPTYPVRGFVSSFAAVRRGFDYVYKAPTGHANPIFVALASDPVVVESEPNDDPAHAPEVALPCEISGRFGKPGDVDCYRFKAKKGETWIVEADSERIGSAADPVVLIQKLNDKSAPQDLMTGEDTPEKNNGAWFNTSTVDATLRWSAAEDGTYLVTINDMYSSQRGDVRLAYRLNIRPERPDFHLFVMPESPNQLDALTVNAGGRALAYVMVHREDGFNGAVRVEAVDLPPGLRCAPVTIPAGQAQSPIVFESEEGVKPVTALVRLVGRARFGDRKEALDYVSGVSALGPDVAHPALGATVIWPGADPRQPQQQQGAPAALRVTRGFVLKVVDPAPFLLTAAPAVMHMTPGSQLTLDLTVKRREGFTEAVAITQVSVFGTQNAQNQPALPPIAKGATTGTFTTKLPVTLSPGIYTFVLQGAGVYPFSKDPKAKTKPNVTVTEPTNAVTLVVRPAPMGVVVKAGSASIKPGGKVEVDVTVNRRDGSKEPVAVSLAAPGWLKLKGEPIRVDPGKPGKLTVFAAPDSPIGPATGVTVRATVPVRGEPVSVDELLPLTIAK